MKRAARPQAVVFDLDGTLVDSLPLVLQSIAHALEPFGGRPTMDIFAHLGGPPERFMPTLLDDIRHAPEAIERMDKFHRANSHLIEPFEGAVAFLRRLRAAGVRLAIWTGRDRESTDRLLATLALVPLFSAVVCGDDLPTHKPDPEGMRTILHRLEVAPGDALFVGDADVDVLGGAACGVDTILIRHERTIAAPVRAKAWRTVETPRAAYDLVWRSVE